MRWMRFEYEGNVKTGRVQDGRVQPVAAGDLLEILRGEGLSPVGDSVPVGEVRPLAPLRPGKIIAVGQNYMDHIREQGAEPPGEPVLFPKFPTSVIGPEEEVRWPEGLTAQVDYEAELAVVIGTEARGLREEDALDVVFGYLPANDVSARDLQFGDGQWTRGKALDTFLPLGPVVVGREEVADPQDLPVTCRVNGETYQKSSTREMLFPVSVLIAFISRSFTLEPGDVILTGTPNGVGYFRDPQVFLNPGDRVEVEVGDFGVLSNPVGPYLKL
jgi:2-keto-4-pentenoate hydratase/2-oxohepta-3-ene-1,7-dioic acid hydratase in catechol pathway